MFVVSSNARLRQDLQARLTLPRWQVFEAGSGAGALELLRTRGGDDAILLLDPVLPDLEPNGFNAIVRDRYPNTQVLMLNSHTGQLLVGSASPTEISARLAEEINKGGAAASTAIPTILPETSRHATEGRIKLRSMIGNSEPMMRTFTITRMVAPRSTTVLVTGESGTGKDLLAQEIHLISARRNQPFVVVNCSAIPEPLLEAELFGYTKGSFTGAVQSRIGRIHAAHGGTLFLDEIGDMPLSLQSKILRFLEQGEVQRLGGNDNLKVDVRVVAATNADLKKPALQTAVSRRPLLSPGGLSHSPPASARADGRPGRAGACVCGEVLSRRIAQPRALEILAPASLAGQCPRIAQRDRAGDDSGWHRDGKSSPSTSFCRRSFPNWAHCPTLARHVHMR